MKQNKNTAPTRDELEQALRAKGHRITNLRLQLIDIFCSAVGPRSVVEVSEDLDLRGVRANRTSIYREIEFLIGERIIFEIDLLDGKKRYERAIEGAAHHHLVCRQCSKVECTDAKIDTSALVRSVKRNRQFTIDSHVLEFFGTCSDCSDGEAGVSAKQ